MSAELDDSREWLEADGLGGFASGTISGIRTRRYHALLLTATTPPTGRIVLVNGVEAAIETPEGRLAIAAERYATDFIHPDGWRRIEKFKRDPWPTWSYRLENGMRVEHSVFVPHRKPMAVLHWKLVKPRRDAALVVRPFLSGRDYHSLHRENASFEFQAESLGPQVLWRPYPHVPAIAAFSNSSYAPQPLWFRNFQYDVERERGLDFLEDLASPGEFRWDPSTREAWLILAAQPLHITPPPTPQDVEKLGSALRKCEQKRRKAFVSPLDRAADAYIVERRGGRTIVAGYPWFTDWGRDTFIAMRGLCLPTGRLDDARELLLVWATTVSEGMLPNRFPDVGDSPEYNSVDAALWFVVAVHDYLGAAARAKQRVPRDASAALNDAIGSILRGYARGTRHNIRPDVDGLLAAGEPGTQLTWMDVKIGDWVVTPRIGKPVEIQALWLNALWIAGQTSPEWLTLFEKGRRSFAERFWNSDGECLYDVVDVDHQPATADATFRPNQVLAVGGLPLPLLEGERARRVVDQVESRLWTPLGLRTLPPGRPDYRPRYIGGVHDRDAAYHQGTVWAWLTGPFVEAWLNVRGNTRKAAREARKRFLTPMIEHLDSAGLGHVSEIADAEPPHTPRGCPFQAWSLGELLRIRNRLLSHK